MRTLLSALLVLLLAWPVVAQVPNCETTQHGKSDHRTKCKGGGSYGVRQNANGSVDELKHERSIWMLGMKRWKAKRLPPPVMEGDPVTVEAPIVVPPAPAPAFATSDEAPVIDVMVLRTPRAENAAGGSSAMDALVVNAVARANLARANSLVPSRLRLVYTGRIPYTEGNITTDLGRLKLPADGFMDSIHALRAQVGADIGVLLGAGYVGQGVAGQGFLMRTVSPAFASSAFSVVDYSQAAAYLSLAHEVGHNEGLNHDWGAAGCGTSCTGFAYGYKVPGVFRTVMSYGGEPRIPYFSNPNVSYNGRPTGGPTQDNARALNANAEIVSQFMPPGTVVPPPPPLVCSYTLSPKTLEFSAAGGSATVWVATTTLCGWNSASSIEWATVKGAWRGSNPATITLAANTGPSRTAQVRVAAQWVTVSQSGQEQDALVDPERWRRLFPFHHPQAGQE